MGASSDLPAGSRLVLGDGDADLDARLSAELTTYNLAATGMVDQRELTVRIEDERGGLVAGLSGWTWGPVAGIGMVWVREQDRRDGFGTRLLAAVEAAARQRGCDRVFVSSFTFQAPAFYERHGYVETTRIADYPLDGVDDVYLVKHLH